MRNFAARTNLWLILGGLVCRTAAAQQAPSFFGSSSPVETTEVVILHPATPPRPGPTPVTQLPSPGLENGRESVPARSTEEMKLDEALGLLEYPDKESEEKFRQFLQTAPITLVGAAPTYGLQLSVVRRWLADRKTLEALRALQGMATACSAVDGHADAELAAWVGSALELHNNLVLQRAKDEQTRMRGMRATANADVLAAAESTPAAKTKPASSPGRALVALKPPPTPKVVVMEASEIEKKLRLKIEQLEAAEAQQEMEKGQLETQQSLESADGRFADLVNRLFTEHKYEQVTLALPFYRQIFGTEQCPTGTVDKAIAAQSMVDRVDALTRMAVAKSKTNEIKAVTAALYGAFADGEYQPAVLDLDVSVRARVKTFLTTVEAVRRGINARDFELTKKYTEHIRQVASDFDAAKLLALLRTYELESDLHASNATRALQEKNFQLAKQEWWSAKKAWRNNPALNAFPGSMRTEGDVHQQALEFDGLLAARDFRSLAENRHLFAEFLAEDAVRLGQLQSAVETVQRLDLSTAQITRTRQAGDICKAWELAEGACMEWPDDVSLKELFRQLSSACPAYAEAIGKARQAEGLKQDGYSLAWYVVAQRRYPASVPAQEALSRLSHEVFSSAQAGWFVTTASR